MGRCLLGAAHFSIQPGEIPIQELEAFTGFTRHGKHALSIGPPILPDLAAARSVNDQEEAQRAAVVADIKCAGNGFEAGPRYFFLPRERLVKHAVVGDVFRVLARELENAVVGSRAAVSQVQQKLAILFRQGHAQVFLEATQAIFGNVSPNLYRCAAAPKS